MTGYVYCMEIEGHPLCKIGHTTDPQRRINEIARHSPAPVSFRHLLEVSSGRHAKAHERFIISALEGKRSHWEWFHLCDMVDDCFEAICPAVSVEVAPTPVIGGRRPNSPETPSYGSGEPVETELLEEIAAFLAGTGTTKSAFGKAVMRDPSLVFNLENGRELRASTRARIRAFITPESSQ